MTFDSTFKPSVDHLLHQTIESSKFLNIGFSSKPKKGNKTDCHNERKENKNKGEEPSLIGIGWKVPLSWFIAGCILTGKLLSSLIMLKVFKKVYVMTDEQSHEFFLNYLHFLKLFHFVY